MKIVTEEFTETIENLISNLRPEDFFNPQEYKLTQKYNALPFGADLFSDVFLTSSGEIIWDDYEGEIGSSTNLQMLINLLVDAKTRYPELEKFIPNQSDDSKTCPICRGFGILENSTGRCFICGGLGWITDETYVGILENSE